MQRRLFAFVILAAMFEWMALIAHARPVIAWLVDAVIAVLVLYLAFLAVRGWRRQQKQHLPPSMTGQVVRRRHWRLF